MQVIDGKTFSEIASFSFEGFHLLSDDSYDHEKSNIALLAVDPEDQNIKILFIFALDRTSDTKLATIALIPSIDIPNHDCLVDSLMLRYPYIAMIGHNSTVTFEINTSSQIIREFVVHSPYLDFISGDLVVAEFDDVVRVYNHKTDATVGTIPLVSSNSCWLVQRDLKTLILVQDNEIQVFDLTNCSRLFLLKVSLIIVFELKIGLGP